MSELEEIINKKHSSTFEEDLRIDPLALDVEWLLQPQLFFKYSEELAKANRELDRIKLKYEVTQAKVDNEIRSKYADKKPTEAAIKSEILQDEEVTKISIEFSDQKKVVDLLNAGVRAFDQRKTALENLVKLQIQNYNASPKEPRDLSVEYNKRMQQDSIRNKIAASSVRRRI